MRIRKTYTRCFNSPGPCAGGRGSKVLPSHGAWITETINALCPRNYRTGVCTFVRSLVPLATRQSRLFCYCH